MNKKRIEASTEANETDAIGATNTGSNGRLPLRGWALELARRWNGGTYSLFVLHGNIFDVFPVQTGAQTTYVPLKTFLTRRLFPERGLLLFYDIGDGLTFGSAEMQKRFFEWLQIYDEVEGTNYHRVGPPRDFIKLAPVLRRFFLRVNDGKPQVPGVTLIIDFPEKVIPASEEAGAHWDERMALVTLLKWASSPELRELDIAVVLVTESAAELLVGVHQVAGRALTIAYRHHIDVTDQVADVPTIRCLRRILVDYEPMLAWMTGMGGAVLRLTDAASS